MIKSATTKFTRLLGLLISLVLICLVAACSNEAESITTGTESGGAVYGMRIASLTGLPCAGQDNLGQNLYSTMAGQNIILTAKVTDGADIPVRNADVYFQFTSNASGANLQSVGGVTGTKIKATTDASGQAIAVYKAGANSTSMELEDIVIATCHDSKVAITIFRVAGIQGLSMIVTADQDSLKAGENTIVRATLTNGSGTPIGGQAVTFALLENNSGATLTMLGMGITDVNGQALAVYKAGATSPTVSVQDTVQASVPGASGVVIMTRVANTAIIGCRITITADVTSLDAGKNTIVRATLLNGDGNPYIGNVKFEFLTNNSGATLSASSVKTNSSGVATVIYTAGSEDVAISIQDIIKATATQCCAGDSCCAETLCCTEAGCCSESIIITRAAQEAVTPTGYKIILTAGKTSLTAGETTIVTATVTDGSSKAVKGQVVNFDFVSGANPSGGSLSVISGTTDASGEAIARYTAGSNTPTVVVQDIILATMTGATGAVILTRTASSPAGIVLTLSTSPSSVTPGNMSELIAKIEYTDGTSVGAGLLVTFTLVQNNSGAYLTNIDTSATGTIVTGVTDGNGEAKAMYNAGNTSPSLSLQDSVSATVTGASDMQFITRAPVPGTSSKIIILSQDPATSESDRIQSPLSDVIITAKVTRGATNVEGEIVTFSIASGDGTINPPLAVQTDGNGEALATFTLPVVVPPADPPGAGQTVIRAVMAGDGGSGDIVEYTIVYWAVWY